MVNISSLLSSIKIIEEISYLAYLSIESFEVKNSPVYHKISISKFADSSRSLRNLPNLTCNIRDEGFVFAVCQEYTEEFAVVSANHLALAVLQQEDLRTSVYSWQTAKTNPSSLTLHVKSGRVLRL